jgi:hypothetical protein
MEELKLVVLVYQITFLVQNQSLNQWSERFLNQPVHWHNILENN